MGEENDIMIECSAYEIVMIVHELHQRGYEQLRLFPCMSPSGMSWRWMIYPKVFVKDCRVERSHDSVPFDCPHGSTSKLRPDDGDTKITADDFLKAYGTYMSLAKGKDPEYVRWFETIVSHAEKNDFPIAFEEYYNAEQWKFISGEPLSYPPF